MITIERFKKFFQVKSNGSTVAQFTSENEAKVYAYGLTSFAAADAHLGEEGVCRRFGTSTRRITIYP